MPTPAPARNVFGMVDTPLVVVSAGTESLVPIDPGAGRKLLAALDKTSSAEPRGLVYLRLESITGDHPTVLNVYVGLPEGASPAEHPGYLAGNIGLYGLQQASRKDANGEGGKGMAFSLDVTKVFKNLRLAGPPLSAAIRVSIMPYRPLPPNAEITVGKLIFFAL